MGKIADEVRPNSEPAHRDQRPEISLLGLFSYDRLSTVAREKGWILPVGSYLSKPVPLSGTCEKVVISLVPGGRCEFAPSVRKHYVPEGANSPLRH